VDEPDGTPSLSSAIAPAPATRSISAIIHAMGTIQRAVPSEGRLAALFRAAASGARPVRCP
jgi:hypothetical protein